MSVILLTARPSRRPDPSAARRPIGGAPRPRVAQLQLLQAAADAGALQPRRDRDRHRVHRVALALQRIVVAALDVARELERRADREADQLGAAVAAALGDDD